MSAAEKAISVMDDAAQRERPVVPAQPLSEAAAILGMIERLARDPNVDVERLERMYALRNEALDRVAREAFASALADLQDDLPVIAERGGIKDRSGAVQSTYALWEDINEAIKPALKAHGFALSFRTGREDGAIVVTGILTHRGGHREETTMHLPVDTSGSKNAVQAIGSSTSYGKRYTAAALLNLTSRAREDRDDDGQASGAPVLVNEEQVKQLEAAIAFKNGSVEKFCRFARVASLSDIRADKFDEALRVIQSTEARK